MSERIAKIANDECPRAAIGIYLDGELAARAELEMQAHLATCRKCAAEFEAQKKLLRVLDFALEEKRFELPENFTKTIVVRAESRVDGLRRPHERLNALLICATLFSLILLGLGSDTETVFGAFGRFFGQFAAIGSFIAHLAYDLAIGVAVILRFLSAHLVFKPAFVSVLLILIVVGFSAFAFSRLKIRLGRV